MFLGHKISKGRVRMDENKVKAIVNWVAIIFGSSQYYRKLIKGYFQKVSPLTNLLKKCQVWAWSNKCEDAFKNLKLAISYEPMLQLPEFDKSFEVPTDACFRGSKAQRSGGEILGT
uniref:Reverse transcriptase/retrotransposon-derived protein RNase H-like domain-containing protein n=1 Tax=Chenopodium quinoa TaxID=63459 RepID=A0A803MKE5_CHEQI